MSRGAPIRVYFEAFTPSAAENLIPHCTPYIHSNQIKPPNKTLSGEFHFPRYYCISRCYFMQVGFYTVHNLIAWVMFVFGFRVILYAPHATCLGIWWKQIHNRDHTVWRVFTLLLPCLLALHSYCSYSSQLPSFQSPVYDLRDLQVQFRLVFISAAPNTAFPRQLSSGGKNDHVLRTVQGLVSFRFHSWYFVEMFTIIYSTSLSLSRVSPLLKFQVRGR